MFTPGSRFSQKPKLRQYYRPGILLAILSAEQLLASKEVRALIHEIKTQSNLPETYFTTLYQEAIDRFANMVQLLPFEDEGILGGLLYRGIARAVLSLRLYLSIFPDEQDPLEFYAIFIANLLFDVGRIITHYTVVLIDENYPEEFIEWQPFVAPMAGHAKYYKLFPKTVDSALHHEVNALLARDLMPTQGFFWLASDPTIFNDFLLTLRGAAHIGTGRISHIFSLVKYEDLQELLVFLGQPPIIEIAEDPLNVEAETFYYWIRNNNIGNGLLPGTYFSNRQFFASGQLLQDYIQAKNLQITTEQLRLKIERLFSFIQNETNKTQVIKQNETNRQHGVNTATLSVFNQKKQNAIALPASLVLKKNQLPLQSATGIVHSLPIMTEKQRKLTSALNKM